MWTEDSSYGLGLTHADEAGEPESCPVCEDSGEVTIRFLGDPIDTVPCPRGCGAIVEEF